VHAEATEATKASNRQLVIRPIQHVLPAEGPHW
jgi:hypothetical protein